MGTVFNLKRVSCADRGGFGTPAGGEALGLIDWLRRLVGAGPARTAPPEIKIEPVVAVRRDRDELTSFISVAPEPPVDATVAVAPEPVETPDDDVTDEREAVAADSPPDDGSDTSPVEPQPQVAAVDVEPAVSEVPAAPDESVQPPAASDSEETLMLEIPRDAEAPPEQEATLFFEVPRVVVGKLVVIKGELKGEEFEIREGENRIGRAPESDIVLPSMWISRSHAVLRCEMGRIEVESVSDKITSVDGEPVSGAIAVPDGAKIQLGGTVCRVELEG